MIKFAIVSTKGGVGKTTLAANLGGVLADMGLRVLLVDADVQPSLSKYFQLSHKAPFGLTYAITKQQINKDCISQTVYPGLDIVLSDDSEGFLQPWLASKIGNHNFLSRALLSPDVNDNNYDCVIIDTQGAQGALQANAALAAHQLILPVVPETIAAREFISGTMDLIRQLEPEVEFKGRAGTVKAVLYRQDRTIDAKTVADELRAAFISLEGRVSMMETAVPKSKAYLEAASNCIPAHRHERSRTGPMLSAYDVMHQLVWELIPQYRGVYAKDVDDREVVNG